MIFYNPRGWSHLLQMSGSVLPRAALWGLLAAVFAICVNLLWWAHQPDEEKGNSRVSTMWFGYTSLLGFLLIFRTTSAYSRYWEGVTLVHRMKGDWLNAMSCVVAFCTIDPSKQHEVTKFLQTVVRFMSLLHCAALQQVANMENENFDVIELSGFDESHMRFLADNHDNTCLILLQWIQKTIIKAMRDEVLDVAAPIMTRVFQQLGTGYTNVIDAQKIRDMPFPFPYDQMVTLLLIVNTFVTPAVCGMFIMSPVWGAALAFFGICGFWSINLIAAEIEMPFGDDANDLPLAEIQVEMNRDLKILMRRESYNPPRFGFKKEVHERLREIKIEDFITAAPSRKSAKGGDMINRIRTHRRKSHYVAPRPEFDTSIGLEVDNDIKPVLSKGTEYSMQQVESNFGWNHSTRQTNIDPDDDAIDNTARPIRETTNTTTRVTFDISEEKTSPGNTDRGVSPLETQVDLVPCETRPEPMEPLRALAKLPTSFDAAPRRMQEQTLEVGMRLETLLVRIADDLARITCSGKPPKHQSYV